MLRAVLMLVACCLCAPLLAKPGAMSEDYVRERERQKFSKPHGFSAEIDAFGLFPYFSQSQRVEANGLRGDTVDWRGDAGGIPFGAFLDVGVRMRFSWHDSIELSYSFAILREFDEFDSNTRWNGFIYPDGVDMDYAADFHDLHLLYRRDLFYAGSANNFNFFIQAGLEWAVIDTQVGSDDFPPQDNRERERFRELLPWPALGAGFVWNFGEHFTLRLDGLVGYADWSTLQNREGRKVNQELFSITGRAAFEWKPIPWFAVLAGVKYRSLNVELESKKRNSEFEWWSVGPEVGVGFRF